MPEERYGLREPKKKKKNFKRKTFLTRTRAVQHKCLPLLACINKTPLLFLKIVTNSKTNLKYEKILPSVCRACRDESIDI